MDYKSETYVFVGYDVRTKGCKLYNPINGKIIISRDVVFNEESSWDWNNTQEDYNFFPFIDDESEEIYEQHTLLPNHHEQQVMD